MARPTTCSTIPRWPPFTSADPSRSPRRRCGSSRSEVTGALWAAASGIGFGLFQGLNRRAVRDIADAYASTFLQLAVATTVLVGVMFASGEQRAIVEATAGGVMAFSLAGIVHFLCVW